MRAPIIRAGHNDRLAVRLRSRGAKLSPALAQVAMYLDAHRLDVLTMSATELGSAIGTSDATVIRTVKALGFDGLPDLRREIASHFGQGATPLDNMNRTITDLDETADHPVDNVVAAHQDAIATMRSGEFRERMSSVIKILNSAKRIVVFGVGPSSFVASYFACLLGRSGRQIYVLSATGARLADELLSLMKGDILVVLAYGQIYREASVTLGEAKRLRLPIVLISDSLDARLTRQADIVLPVTRGRSGRVALHGATVVCLEAMMVGLASMDRLRATAGLDRLNSLRKLIRTGHSSGERQRAKPD